MPARQPGLGAVAARMPETCPAEELQPGFEFPQVLRDYALIADGERGVLVGPRGDFTWMCFPQWDGDALFSSLIGGGGAYAVTPRGRFVWGGYYESGSLIWRSRWRTEDSIVECREALALPSSPGRAVILRRVVAVSGKARVRVVLNPRADFGREPVEDLGRDDSGAWRARLGAAQVSWSGAADAAPCDDGHGGQALTMPLELESGEHHDFVLVLDATNTLERPPDPDKAWQGTETAWRDDVPSLEGTLARRDAGHAYSVLRGLTATGGGMVAAATTSLPERAGQGRDFDYRYVWIRDQCYAGQAVAKAGAYRLLDDAVGFVRDRLLDDGPQLKPAYTLRGRDIPNQRKLDLPGYPGGSDVIGNHVNRQWQLDTFGEALLLLAAAADHDRLDAGSWRAAEIAARAIAERWRQPDAGVWEIDPDEWTHGRLICVAGLREMSRHQPAGQRTVEWLSLADRLQADIAERCLHPEGHWQRSPADARLDASLLLAPIRGAVSAEDPRSVATLRAIERDLTQDGYIYRFRPDERPLGEAEGAFLLCSFWMALALGQQGDRVGAARWFERGRSACGPPGLLAEEFDVRQRQLRGNLPQAFVHALLLETAVTLGESPEGELGRFDEPGDGRLANTGRFARPGAG